MVGGILTDASGLSIPAPESFQFIIILFVFFGSAGSPRRAPRSLRRIIYFTYIRRGRGAWKELIG